MAAQEMATHRAKFLLARYAERVAHLNACENWTECGPIGGWDGYQEETYGCRAHTPVWRALEEIKALREVVSRCAEACGMPSREGVFAGQLLVLLAEPFSDHPDFPPGPWP
jgi:hypothetical protein